MKPLCFSTGSAKHLGCMSCRHLHGCSGTIGRASPEYDVPEEVKLQITTRCNLDCAFCFAPERYPDISKTGAIRIIDNIADSHVKAIRITGGEPCLREDLPEIIKYARKKGLYVILNTNATVKNPALGLADEILVSFHNIDEGKISLVGRSGYRASFCTILTTGNIKTLESYYQIFSQIPADWFLLRPVPTETNPHPWSQDDARTAIRRIWSLNNKYKIHVQIANAVPYCAAEIEMSRSVLVGGINDDGRSLLAVDARGRIHPSYFIKKDLGSALSDSIYNAWHTEAMRQLRSLEIVADGCRQCPYLEECMSGLRYSAWLISGSYSALDPLANPAQVSDRACS
ncbi:MAG: radical SAM protein [archaeon]